MIYISNITTPQRIIIPKPTETSLEIESVRLTITNVLTREEVYSGDATDRRTFNAFWSFDVTLPTELAVGEYEYAVRWRGETLSRGLMQIGAWIRPTAINDEVIVIKQYGDNE